MNKYKVFRSFGVVDRDVNKHELVAVEYGDDIYEVTDQLIQAVNDDASGLPQFQKGFTAKTEAPEPIDYNIRRVKRYQYYMVAILMPDYGDHNELIEYGIIEEESDELPFE